MRIFMPTRHVEKILQDPLHTGGSQGSRDTAAQRMGRGVDNDRSSRRASAASQSRSLERLPQVLRRCGIGKTTAFKLVREGKFPKPTKIGRISAWDSQVVDDWIEQQVA